MVVLQMIYNTIYTFDVQLPTIQLLLLISDVQLLDKEITSAKERLDIESTAQRSTLQEQRTHIEILDKALSNAQAGIIRMEDEVSTSCG